MQRHYLVLYALVLALWVSGCAGSTGAKNQALTPVYVQLAWTHQSQFAGMYAADQQGFYKTEGLDITFIEGGSKVDKLMPVLEGTAQFGIAGADELILARAQGKPLRAIATIYRRSPIVFVSLSEKNITRPQEFVGKTVRAPANVSPSLHAMMARVGITPEQYAVADVPSDLARFASGDIPVWGAYINSFVVAIRQAGYEFDLIFPDDYGVHFYSDTLFTTDDLLATNPDLVKRFLRATLNGWAYAVENPAKVSVMVQEYSPQLDATIENDRMIVSLPLVNTGEDHIGWMKPDVWAGMAQTLREQKILDMPLDPADVYTMQFLLEIYEQ